MACGDWVGQRFMVGRLVYERAAIWNLLIENVEMCSSKLETMSESIFVAEDLDGWDCQQTRVRVG